MGIAFVRGDKRFELSNHLGNTISILTDRKLQVADAGLSLGYYFTGDVIAARDYYPFGMLMPERNVADDGYRYGFQGQETDKELLDGAVNYKYRVHDPRIGKFLSVDPLSSDYPWNSPYAFSENRLVDAVELEGLEKHIINSPDLSYKVDEAIHNFDPQRLQELFDYMKQNPGFPDGYYDKLDGSKNNNVEVYDPNYRGLEIWGREGIYENDKDGKPQLVGLGDYYLIFRSNPRPPQTTPKYTNLIKEMWNSNFARFVIPDFPSIGVGVSYIGIGGGTTSFEAQWVVRGPEASIWPVITTTQGVGVGFDADAVVIVGGANYLGNPNDIGRDMIPSDLTIWGSGAISIGGNAGVTATYAPGRGGGILGRYLSFGLGSPAGPLPINGAGGVSKTTVIEDLAEDEDQ